MGGFISGFLGGSVLPANTTALGNLTVAGQLLLASGTASAPGLAFAAEPGLGWRRGSASSMRAMVNSLDHLTVAVGDVATSQPLRVAAALCVVPETVKTANYPATASDSVVIMNGAGLTLTLPASPAASQMLHVRNNDAGNLTVARNAQNINAVAADLTMAAGTAAVLSFISGSGWFVVG